MQNGKTSFICIKGKFLELTLICGIPKLRKQRNFSFDLKTRFCIFIFFNHVLKYSRSHLERRCLTKVLLWCNLHNAQTHNAISVNFTINRQPSIRRVIDDLHAAKFFILCAWKGLLFLQHGNVT